MSIVDPPTAEVQVRRPNAAPHAARNVRPARRRPGVLDEAFDVAGLVRLRSAVAACAVACGVGPALDDLVLTAYELCSNAVKYGGGSGRLRMWRQGRRILCQVADTGPGMVDAASRGLESPAPHATGGRGLWIARRLADVRIDTGSRGTTVTAAITVPDNR
jgi:serine/threonine-protein kinase RsbW